MNLTTSLDAGGREPDALEPDALARDIGAIFARNGGRSRAWSVRSMAGWAVPVVLGFAAIVATSLFLLGPQSTPPRARHAMPQAPSASPQRDPAGAVPSVPPAAGTDDVVASLPPATSHEGSRAGRWGAYRHERAAIRRAQPAGWESRRPNGGDDIPALSPAEPPAVATIAVGPPRAADTPLRADQPAPSRRAEEAPPAAAKPAPTEASTAERDRQKAAAPIAPADAQRAQAAGDAAGARSPFLNVSGRSSKRVAEVRRRLGGIDAMKALRRQ